MHEPLDQPPRVPFDDHSATRGDAFSFSILLLIGVMLSQRVIGLVRNVLFCGMLSEDELGRWALANNYLGWAAPFVILGLPGSFGRLSEYFRQRGQLRTLLWRTATASGGLVVVAVLVHAARPEWFARLIYNHAEQAALVPLLGVVLGAVVVMNFLVDFLISIRLSRIVSRMYLVQSLGFAVLSVMLLSLTHLREEAVMAAFGAASALAAMIGFVHARRIWNELPTTDRLVPAASMWRKVGLLAVWIWCGNSIANLFDCVDQFLLKHYLDLAPTTVDAMIGQLYASRILPVLIVSVATLVAGCLLPYLIQDWELGRRDALRERMNGVLKFSAIGFTAIAAVTHIASPVLFTWFLRGKYDDGLALMPWGFVQYTWFSLLAIAAKYLICIDRARTGIWPFLLGLLTAIPLNILFVSWWELTGVVVAMAAANGMALGFLLWVTSRCGMQWDRNALLAAVLPLAMSLGGWATLGILAAIVVGGWQSGWLITRLERQQLLEVLVQGWARRFARGRSTHAVS